MSKKLFFSFMVLVGAIMLLTSVNSQAVTVKHRLKTVTSNSVVTTAGTILYKVSGYASAANALYGIYSCATLGTATASTAQVEGGEASQYDSLTYLDFGPEGIEFPSGLTIVTSGAYVTIEYQ